MSTAETREVVTRMYAAALGGDLQGMIDTFSPDIVVLEPPHLPYGGAYHGRDAVLASFTRAVPAFDMAAAKLLSVTTEDDLAFGVLRMVTRAGIEIAVTEQWRVADGKIVWGRVNFHDATVKVGIED